MILQGRADIEKIRPALSHCDVIVEFSSPISFKLVVPATNQGSLLPTKEEDTGFRIEGEANSTTNTPEACFPDPERLKATSLDEAEQIAAAAAVLSMQAVDIGNFIAARATKQAMSMEDATELFSQSPDNHVSRKIYVRARGPKRTIRYTKGEKSIGGGLQISAYSHSNETFSLRGCLVSPSDRHGILRLEGNLDDTDWLRLNKKFPGTHVLIDDKNRPAMQILLYASVAGISVDLEVCVSEKIDSRRRCLFPLRVLNQKEVISQARDRLDLLEETCS